MSHFFQFLLHLNEQRDIFLDTQPAYKTEHMVAVAGLSFPHLRREQLRIDAARHQVARPPGGAFQQGA